MRRFEMVLAAALAVGACETTAPTPPAEVQPAFGRRARATRERRAHVGGDASARVRRVSGTVDGRRLGEEKTVAYLIEQFRAAGLEPGGENGGWTQTVPMIRTKLQSPMDLSIRQAGRTTALRFPDDVYLSTVRAVERGADRRRADGLRRLRRDRARARLGRFQGRRPEGQGRGLPGQRSGFRSDRGRAGRRQVRRPDA